MSRAFETDVQRLKYRILKAVATHVLEENMGNCYYDIPHEIIQGKKATMRCCVYKERAIVEERVHNILEDSEHVIQVIDIACDECPIERYSVNSSCRGCLAHRCMNVCPRGAISKTDNGRAKIDPEKCVRCGRCATVCPYGAITENIRPCERSCKIGAIRVGDQQKAEIDYDKCINCGSCVSQCPFGAVVDHSNLVDAMHLVQGADRRGYYVIAVVAPAIASQFSKATVGQVKTALRNFGFHDVVEAALGADMVTRKETRELAEKGFLTSSCCPAFVRYIQQHVPEMAKHISHNLSPMAEICRYIKENSAWPVKTVFIGPCTAKKYEQKLPNVSPWVDCVITFEEVQAMLDAAGFPPEEQEDLPVDDASYFGRIFARVGGLSEAVAQSAKEQGLDIKPNPVVCSGIEECKVALLKAKMGKLSENFIEGMACAGGCINGAGTVSHTQRDRTMVEKFGRETRKESINMSVKSYQTKF